MAREADYDYLFKIVLVGDSGTGKTNLLSQFTNGGFRPRSASTIGIDFATKIVNIDGKRVKVQIMDTAGKERYRSLIPTCFSGALGALLVYDITGPFDVHASALWLKDLKNRADSNIVIMLVGNKSDLNDKRVVKSEEGKAFAVENGLLFTETSALDGSSVDLAFKLLLNDIYRVSLVLEVAQSSSQPNDPPGKPQALPSSSINSTPQALYKYEIPSIWDKHPNLPKKLGPVQIDKSIAVDDVVQDSDLEVANALVQYLESIYRLGVEKKVTESVIQTAKLRAEAIKIALIEAHL